MMHRQNLNPDDEIIDIMMEDDSFIKGNFRGVDRETVKNILSGKQTEIPRNLTAEQREQGKTAGMKMSELYCGSIQVKVSPDCLTGKICLYPDGELTEITALDIEDALFYFGITTGVNNAVIRRLSDTPIYNRDFLIAKGTAAEEGTAGEIKFTFEADKTPKYTPNEHGRVNYKELDIIRTVQEGELLCEWVDGTEGTDGIDIYGNRIPATPPKAVYMQAGKNTQFSEDRQQIFAACEGEVSCRGGVVSVDKILKLNNVDATTGNIRFIGSIHIAGKVCEGYVVKATQNIIVKDVIENSCVSAGNNLTVERGIIGSDEIRVDGSLTTEFIEGSTVVVKKNIKADVILTSKVFCEGKILLNGKKGSLIGGECTAREIEILKLGNEAHARTEVTLLSLDALEKEREQAVVQLKECEKRVFDKQEQYDVLFDMEENDRKAIEMKSEILRIVYEKNSCKAHVDKLTEQLEYLGQAYMTRIVVKNKAFPNIRVKISGRIYTSSEVLTYCTFRFDGSDIVVSMN